jgi:hypothetical protein
MARTSLQRADLVKALGTSDPKIIQGFEAIQTAALTSADAVEANVAATQGIQNATVIVLSPNDAFENEYVLAVAGLTLTVKDGKVIVGLPFTLAGPGRLTINRLADTNVTLPTAGVLATTASPGPYADDATAASNGVAVGESYAKTGGTVAWRVS